MVSGAWLKARKEGPSPGVTIFEHFGDHVFLENKYGSKNQRKFVKGCWESLDRTELLEVTKGV